MTRSVAVLFALSCAFLAAFALQRSRSGFLAVEARAEQLRGPAGEHGLQLAEALALHELLGAELPVDAVQRHIAAFAVRRARYGDAGLAALAVAGHAELAERLLAEAGGDAARARVALRSLPEATFAVRFETMIERFARRGHG